MAGVPQIRDLVAQASFSSLPSKLPLRLAAAVLAGALAASAARADIADISYTLTDGNSTAIVDPSSSAGMDHWDVSGINELNQQWFWYRIGNTPTAPINTISTPTILSNPQGGGDPAVLKTLYTSPGVFSIEIDYTLTGGGAGGGIETADIGESIRIKNLSASTLDMHFFQYSDFNLGTADSVAIGTNPSGLYNSATQTDSNNFSIEENGIAPGANRAEAALAGVTLAELNGGSAANLSNTLTAGPGNVTWALQWDLPIPVGGTQIISKDKLLSVDTEAGNAPEPASLALLATGALGLGLRRPRRR